MPFIWRALLCVRAALGAAPLYRDPTASIAARADDLLARMTTDEKIAQTWAPYGSFDGDGPAAIGARFNGTGVGQLSYGAAGAGDPSAMAATRNAVQQAVLDGSRLGIPASFSQEALHSAGTGATVFPESVTLGGSWDVALVENVSAAIAREARALGVDVAFAPVINLWADARFGRLQEGYSENPALTSAYAAAAARGFQGRAPDADADDADDDGGDGGWFYLGRDKLVALAKHYAAYGAALGGLNGAPAELTTRTLNEVYLAPWRAFARAGGRGAMAAHNTVDGVPCHSNGALVNGALRGALGFGDGIVVSDCNDVRARRRARRRARVGDEAEPPLFPPSSSPPPSRCPRSSTSASPRTSRTRPPRRSARASTSTCSAATGARSRRSTRA